MSSEIDDRDFPGNSVEIIDSSTGNRIAVLEVDDLGSEVEQRGSETSQIEYQENLDSPDLIRVRSDSDTGNGSEDNTKDTDTAALCETLYESECSNDYIKNINLDSENGQYMTIIGTNPSESSTADDIPNDILVYTCQPERDDPLDMFPCKTCGMVTGCIFCLKSHYESVHLQLGIIQYKCNQTTYLRTYTEICHKCNLVCESQDEMFEHRKIHFVNCDVCDMSFDNALFLSNHCKTAHEKFEVIISCDLCEQWFKHLQDLSKHYQNYHEMILCIVCFKRFSNISELTAHHGTHSIVLSDVKPILPYACSKCNRAFAEISDLSSHLVKDHPTRKATYGSIAKKRVLRIKAKHRQKERQIFDDCGGLSQEESVQLENQDTSGKRSKLD